MLEHPQPLPLDLFTDLQELRATNPVLEIPDLGLWVVSRYEECIAVIRDPERFTSTAMGDTMDPVPDEFGDALPTGYPVDYPALVNSDPPGHSRIRKLAQKAFAPSAVARHEPLARAIADELIDGFVGDGGVELVARFARPLPCTMLATILGVPPADQSRFIGWGLGVTELMAPGVPADRARALAAGQVAFSRYLTAIIAERRNAPRKDAISELIHATADGEPALTEREIIAIVAQLLTAGFETTMAAITNTVMLLCHHPDVLARALADPAGMLPAVIEESLRRLPPARGTLRQTTCDVELAGHMIPAGARVFALLGSANHDASQFRCPEAFDVDRDGSEQRRHLAFGQGIHFCIGAPLARMEIRVALERLLTRLPGLRLDPDQQLAWAPSFVFNGPTALKVCWEHSHAETEA